jgi:hypothetical protein
MNLTNKRLFSSFRTLYKSKSTKDKFISMPSEKETKFMTNLSAHTFLKFNKLTIHLEDSLKWSSTISKVKTLKIKPHLSLLLMQLILANLSSKIVISESFLEDTSQTIHSLIKEKPTKISSVINCNMSEASMHPQMN